MTEELGHGEVHDTPDIFNSVLYRGASDGKPADSLGRRGVQTQRRSISTFRENMAWLVSVRGFRRQ